MPRCMYQSGWEVFLCADALGGVIVVVEGRVIIGVVLHIRITYIPGGAGCRRRSGKSQTCSNTPM